MKGAYFLSTVYKPLTRLEVKNLQSIKDISINFHDTGLHWLRGDGNIGKSALLRAMTALFTNVSNMKYKEYIRYNCNYFTVKGYFGDDFEDYVKLSRGSQDYYEWQIDGVYGRVDKTAGKVPPELIEYFGLYHETEKTKRYLNITAVGDPLLFASTSGGDNYYLLQKALGTENVSEAMKIAQTKKKEAVASLKVNQTYLDNEQEMLLEHKQKHVDVCDKLEYLERFEKVLVDENSVLEDIREMVTLTRSFLDLAGIVREDRILVKETDPTEIAEELLDLGGISELMQLNDEVTQLEETKTRLTSEMLAELELSELDSDLELLEIMADLLILGKEMNQLKEKATSLVTIPESEFNLLETTLEELLTIRECQGLGSTLSKLEGKKAEIKFLDETEFELLTKTQGELEEILEMKLSAHSFKKIHADYTQKKVACNESDIELESLMDELGVCPLCGSDFETHKH